MPDEAILLSMVNCWVAIAVILSLWIGDKVKCRTLVSIVPTVISTVGAALVLTLPMAQKAARLAAFYLCVLSLAKTLLTIPQDAQLCGLHVCHHVPHHLQHCGAHKEDCRPGRFPHCL